MHRLLPPGLVALAATLALTGCGGLQRTAWQPPTQRPTGTEITVGVELGACDSFHGITVRETDQDVTLQAYINRNARSQCDAILEVQPHTVQLRALLGKRPLLGCNPTDALYRLSDGVSNEDCITAEHP